ncbi:MAG: T9SS C-terminal target domain-containing protein [Cytophagales bacterium]|nr:MAG: T9SS C-terminal target domain-containing protein [Cytophagales bacterium]
MNRRSTLLLFLLLSGLASYGQSTEGIDACQTTKTRYFGKVFRDAQARQASVANYLSGQAYPGDSTIDITYYGLNLRLTHTPAYLNGATTISFKATSANLSRFFLDLNTQHKVDSIKVGRGGAGAVLTFVRETNRVQVTLPQPLSIGQAYTLTVFYQGNPASASGFGSFAFATHGPTNAPVIWSLSEPYGTQDWFPCKDTPADKADSSAVDLTADKQFVSVSNGRLIGTTDNPDGTRTYRWRNSYPIAHYLISLAMTNYQQYDTPFTSGTQTMPVNHYVYPETLPSIQANLDLTPNMLRIFTERFGPYPFLREKYGHAEFNWRGGMEHQTISSMGAWNPGIIAHELGHQWFGDKITCRNWQNIWLNEGFATYSEALYVEATGGATSYNANINGNMTRARSATGTLYVQNISSINSIFDNNRSYSKGAVVLHMLRGVLGEDVFFRAIKNYVAAPNLAYGTAITEDFQAIVEQTAGRKLDYFFREWIYGQGFPTYRVTWQDASTTGKPGVQVRLTQTPGTNPVSFTMPVQMRVGSAAGDTLVTVFNDLADQTFTLPAKGAPTGVVIDPNNLIMKQVTSTSMTVTGIEDPSESSLVVYPNPASDKLTVKFKLEKPGTVTVSLVNLLGSSVSSHSMQLVKSGEQTLSLPVPPVAAGRYILRVDTPTGRQSVGVMIR